MARSPHPQDLHPPFQSLTRNLEPEQVERWLADQDLHGEELMRLMADEARIRRVLHIHASDLDAQLPRQLRITGEYGPLAARARAKMEDPGLADAGVDEDELWRSYFEERLGRPRPFDLDAYARSLDLADQAALRRIVGREFCLSLPGTSPRRPCRMTAIVLQGERGARGGAPDFEICLAPAKGAPERGFLQAFVRPLPVFCMATA